jgi:hypothetical protein
MTRGLGIRGHFAAVVIATGALLWCDGSLAAENRDGVGPILGVVAWRLDVLRLIFVDGLRAPLLRWPEV